MPFTIRWRIFSLCRICTRDIARWENGDNWWHLDGWVHHNHAPEPIDNGRTASG